ncbi:MAG: histidine--tRNA ligase, partial [Candidatus Marinimicrobia bacterium]|nr:histidine--tRNA ligase [Candidatus Neomarinimicrobiota bacterium]
MIRSQKGTHDLLPSEIGKWHKVEALLRDIFLHFSYEEIRTPLFEKTALFARGIGEFTDIVSKEMYTFQDKGKESLTLRPEYTASVVRSYIQHNRQQLGHLHRVWYMGPLFRQERPQKGRQRQFHQFGVECIGAEGAQADAEVITLAWKTYENLGLKKIELKINSIGSADARKEYIKILRNKLKSKLEDFCPLCQERFEGNTLRLFDCKNETCGELMRDFAPHITDHISGEDKVHFKHVQSLLAAADIPFTLDTGLVRGLDYYTRTTFEIQGKTLGAQD